MIISHKHKYIFIKTKKTAGTSLEIALSRFCGEDDIITPILPEDEKVREILGYRGPQNYKIPYSSFSFKDWGRLVLKGKQPRGFFNHISASRIRLLVDDQIWSSYFKFCFERNPWDKMISWYYWENRSDPKPTFSEFLATERAYQVGGPGGIDLYTINDEVVVDKVYLFEELPQALDNLTKRLNLPSQIQMPKTKSRGDKRHYQQILSDDDRNRIAHAFKREIKLFDYQY